MHNLSVPVSIALVTFIVGIAATTAWFINWRFAEPDVRRVIPAASWEPIFFKDINAVTKSVGLTNLRDTKLAVGEVEARVWWGGGLEPLEGVALKIYRRSMVSDTS